MVCFYFLSVLNKQTRPSVLFPITDSSINSINYFIFSRTFVFLIIFLNHHWESNPGWLTPTIFAV